MAQNLAFDPVAKDYVVTNGSPSDTDSVLEASYYAIQIPQDNWLYGQDGQGSKVYTLAGKKRTSSIEQQFAAYANAALQSQLISTGKATSSQVTNIAATRTGSSNEINVTPANTQLSTQLNFVPV